MIKWFPFFILLYLLALTIFSAWGINYRAYYLLLYTALRTTTQFARNGATVFGWVNTRRMYMTRVPKDAVFINV